MFLKQCFIHIKHIGISFLEKVKCLLSCDEMASYKKYLCKAAIFFYLLVFFVVCYTLVFVSFLALALVLHR